MVSVIKPGLASVTFRQLNPPQIVALCRQASLTGIEWDGDIHVPHGDWEMARRVHELTVSGGLEVAAYGSYYRAGASERDGLAFEKVLETAAHLRAPLIRVRAGNKPSADADEAYVNWIAGESIRIAGLAAAAGIQVACEHRAGTLTDTLSSSAALLERARHPNLFFLWQPAGGKTASYNLQTLKQVLPRLSNIHVSPFRQPLTVSEANWREYLAVLQQAGRQRYALLEFVKNDAPEQFLQDAATLRAWLGFGTL